MLFVARAVVPPNVPVLGGVVHFHGLPFTVDLASVVLSSVRLAVLRDVPDVTAKLSHQERVAPLAPLVVVGAGDYVLRADLRRVLPLGHDAYTNGYHVGRRDGIARATGALGNNLGHVGSRSLPHPYKLQTAI